MTWPEVVDHLGMYLVWLGSVVACVWAFFWGISR